ncbi:GntR family transcriptional regulator [Pararhizobium haloflavum]|uniref:GntR family transcriptional regulator n=1 Tax=Pararhizobium haloflavum TaxID=2037914 RepID=UPI000C195D43|nr:GntR family transcriptional regulator [Pararhizobium haloflavum]
MMRPHAETRLALSRTDVTLSLRLVGAMRDAILDGTLEPGRHLPERELCALFDVSRSLVREALQALAAEGLITIVPHRGPKVTLIDRDAARDLYRVRAALEGLACAEFAERADASQRDAFFAAAARLQTLSEDDPPQRLIDAKNVYYERLLSGCRNQTLADMFTRLNNRIVQLRRLSLSAAGRLGDTLREIAAVVAAVERRDPVEARRLAELHVERAAAVADRCFAERQRSQAIRNQGDADGQGNI